MTVMDTTAIMPQMSVKMHAQHRADQERFEAQGGPTRNNARLIKKGWKNMRNNGGLTRRRARRSSRENAGPTSNHVESTEIYLI